MAAKFLDWLLDLIYPPRCILCRKLLQKGEKSVCARCADTLLDYDGAPPVIAHADRCVVTLAYTGTLREAFLRYKFEGCRHYAPQFAAWMSVTIRDKLQGQFDLLTFAPVSDKRRRERGYDQSELLCREIAKILGVPMLRTLQKCRHTQAQSSLNDANKRAENVCGVYRAVNPEAFRGKRLLLIDDIVTTGATLGECCRVLTRSGAQQVCCAALASRHDLSE